MGRLGLDHLASDHWHSLVIFDGAEAEPRLSWLDVTIFFGLPVGVGAAALIRGAEITSFSDLIQGAAIITGLLFGLLVHVLTVGMRLYDDPRQTRASRIVILTDELRANVSYAIGVGIVLTGTMMLVAAFTQDPGPGEPPAAYPVWLSAVVLAVVLHLLLTLFMILNRVRSTYKQLGK